MRGNNLLAILTGVCLSVAGCSLDSEFEPEDELDGRIPLNINGSISQVHTKATADGFVDKDAVGLFAVNYGENNTVAGTLAAEGNQADNVKYVFDESTHKWVPVKSVYYKNADTNVDLYLYYPYQKSISDVNEAGFEVQKDQSAAATNVSLGGYEASDFLWGKAENVTPVESAVSIRLGHKMAAVQVTLAEKAGFGEGEFAGLEKSVIVTNTTRKAKINYATGSVTPVGGPQSDGIVMCQQSDGSFRAVVIPQSVSAGTRLFSITIDGVSYGFKQAEDVVYSAGKQLNVTINITKKSPAGDYELELAESQIVDWTEDRNTHGGEARQYYVVNVETPGELGKLIRQARKNPDRIRNLKVTGQIKDSDFYFMRDSMAILEAVNLKECNAQDDVIPGNAFNGKKTLCYFSFPERIVAIENYAFRSSYNLSKIQSSAIEPPTIKSDTFDGVAKDNFTVEVPAQSVKRYQAETGWSDFKRISAHYDFALSRERMRALNAEQSRTYILRAPANFAWTVESKPDWVTVSPSSGTGKTDVTITVSEMPRTSETFEVNEGSFNNPSYKRYSGRSGEVVFKLTEKDYTTTFDVEQYDCDLSDGEVRTYQRASKGAGIDIVFIGDGYDAKDITKGAFFDNADSGVNAFFDVEPYKTYKDYFNVYAVVSKSDESGIGTVNTIIDTKFGSTFSQNRILAPDPTPCFAWAKKAKAAMDLSKSLTILLMNTSTYEGVTMMYGDGSAIACCPVSTDAYPYDFRGIIQHEAGGHGFGKLGDEYIYHNAFIQNCSCNDCDHPKGDDDLMSSYGYLKSKGWYKNLSMSSDATQVPWAHLIYNPKYSNYVDVFKGGYMHSRGMYRSEAVSCMNNNIPYYSAISRQAIVERIMECAGETFSLEKFYELDSDKFGTIPATKTYSDELSFGKNFVKATGAAPKYMGEHPEIK